MKVAEGLAGLCESEDFLTIWQEFFTNEERGELLMLEQELIVPLVSHTPVRKAQYRPFTDFLAQVRRKTAMA